MTIRYLKKEDLCRPELQLYNERAETKLYRYFEPEPGLFIAETPLVIERALAAGYGPVSLVGEEQPVKTLVESMPGFFNGIPVYAAAHEVLRFLAGYELTKGLLCAMRRKNLPDLQTVCASASRIVVLEELMNPTNVGAIFRSAAALGMDGILLTKGCADPLYRRSIRVSMGNVFRIPWTCFDDSMLPQERVHYLRELGFYTVAMSPEENAESLGERAFSLFEKVAVFMGSEFKGLCRETIRSCDLTLKIPMEDGVDSLNVAAAGAVAFWELRKK